MTKRVKFKLVAIYTFLLISLSSFQDPVYAYEPPEPPPVSEPPPTASINDYIKIGIFFGVLYSGYIFKKRRL